MEGQNNSAKNAILLILNLILLGVIIFGGYKLWRVYNPVMSEEGGEIVNSGGEINAPVPEEEGEVCIQIIAYAANPETGECEEFPTPCDVPEGWESCSPTEANTEEPAESADKPAIEENPATEEGAPTEEPDIIAEETTEPDKIYLYYFKGEMGNDCSVATKVSLPLDTRYEVDEVAALITLLSSLPDDLVSQGYYSEIPPYTRLRDLRISGEGAAIADFNETLNVGGGSCAMTARRAQIENTLLQFPDIKEVIITVNGDADAALQP